MSPQHIQALLTASGNAKPTKSKRTVAYRGGTTPSAVVGRDRHLAAVYPGFGSERLGYTLTLGSDYLPRELDVRVRTPGTNVPYWRYHVTYTGWGDGDEIRPPRVPPTKPTAGPPRSGPASASPRPSAVTSRPAG